MTAIEYAITLKDQQRLRVFINAELEKANGAMLDAIDTTEGWSVDMIVKHRIPEETKIFANYHASILSILDKLDEIEGKPPRELAE